MSATDTTTGLTVPTPGQTAPAATTEYDIAFPVIPINQDPSPPTVTIRVNDLADFSADQNPADDSYDAYGILPEDSDILFDWTLGEPVAVEAIGGATWVADEEYLVQWFGKALSTPRAQYPIYDQEYGSALQSLIGSGLPDQTLFSEVARDVVRCGTYHPRILAVTVLALQRVRVVSLYALLIDVELTLDTSEDPITVQLRY